MTIARNGRLSVVLFIKSRTRCYDSANFDTSPLPDPVIQRYAILVVPLVVLVSFPDVQNTKPYDHNMCGIFAYCSFLQEKVKRLHHRLQFPKL